MSRNSVRHVLTTLVILLALGTIYVMNSGLYPRYFDIEWDEELRTHEGKVITVNVKKTYERLGNRLVRYDDHAPFIGNQFVFKSAEWKEPISFSSRLGVKALDYVNGEWFVVLRGQGPYGNFPEEMPTHWGDDFTVQEERVAKLVDDKFVPISWDSVPEGALLLSNTLRATAPVSVLASFKGKTMTLLDKEQLAKDFPPNPGALRIERPLRMKKKLLGESK